MKLYVTAGERASLMLLADRLRKERQNAEALGRTWHDGHVGVRLRSGPFVKVAYTPSDALEVTVLIPDSATKVAGKQEAAHVAAEILMRPVETLQSESLDGVICKYRFRGGP